MADKKHSSEEEKKNGSKESIERLDPITTENDEVDPIIANGEKSDGFSVDHLFQDDDKELDHSIDSLFEEDRKSLRGDLLDDVEKALSRPEMSKASLFRMRMKEPSESALTDEIAKLKTPEELWDEPLDESTKSVNRKSVLVMSIFVILIAIACGWALWQSTKDQRGNEENLMAEQSGSEAGEQEKESLKEELSGVSEVMGRYLSAISVSQKSDCIYQAESLRDEIEEYYKGNDDLKPMSGYNIKHIFPLNLAGEKMWEVFMKDQHARTKEYSRFYVRRNPAGDYKVDWKADVAFQENDINEFIEERSKIAKDFKFIVEPMTELPTYNWGFTDSEYEVLRLALPNSDIVLWGYVKKNSKEKEKLTDYIKTDRKNWLLTTELQHEFILKIRFLEDSPNENDQYVFIDDVISRKWIYADK